MHAKTLEYLIKNLKPGGKALDIGTGSGYMATALALQLGPKGKVYTIDHIEEICEFAKTNIMKSHKELIENKNIEFVVKDGKNGLEEKGPFDVIHVGAAPDKKLEVLLK